MARILRVVLFVVFVLACCRGECDRLSSSKMVCTEEDVDDFVYMTFDKVEVLRLELPFSRKVLDLVASIVRPRRMVVVFDGGLAGSGDRMFTVNGRSAVSPTPTTPREALVDLASAFVAEVSVLAGVLCVGMAVFGIIIWRCVVQCRMQRSPAPPSILRNPFSIGESDTTDDEEETLFRQPTGGIASDEADPATTSLMTGETPAVLEMVEMEESRPRREASARATQQMKDLRDKRLV